jgi:DNA repair photolyase
MLQSSKASIEDAETVFGNGGEHVTDEVRVVVVTKIERERDLQALEKVETSTEIPVWLRRLNRSRMLRVLLSITRASQQLKKSLEWRTGKSSLGKVDRKVLTSCGKSSSVGLTLIVVLSPKSTGFWAYFCTLIS